MGRHQWISSLWCTMVFVVVVGSWAGKQHRIATANNSSCSQICSLTQIDVQLAEIEAANI